MIQAKIIADSIGPNKIRLTTWVLTYPRFFHSEVMTHRMFSRNASSSRAIPVKKQIQMVLDNPAIPLAFTKNQKGMQGGEVLSGEMHDKAKEAWLQARDAAAKYATILSDLEVHKQYANRILEPFAHISMVCTATEWSNFYALRCHRDAQPEIHELADIMYDTYHSTTPTELKAGDWHLPFITEKDQNNTIEDKIKMSVARSARVSYMNHEGKNPTLDEDLTLYNRLLGSNPKHCSPAEHPAMATEKTDMYGNFRGWVQYRKTLTNENIDFFRR
jgi:thymidylate synthase ThyX